MIVSLISNKMFVFIQRTKTDPLWQYYFRHSSSSSIWSRVSSPSGNEQNKFEIHTSRCPTGLSLSQRTLICSMSLLNWRDFFSITSFSVFTHYITVVLSFISITLVFRIVSFIVAAFWMTAASRLKTFSIRMFICICCLARCVPTVKNFQL